MKNGQNVFVILGKICEMLMSAVKTKVIKTISFYENEVVGVQWVVKGNYYACILILGGILKI